MSAFEQAWDAFRGVVDDVELDRLLKDIEREHAHGLAEKIRAGTIRNCDCEGCTTAQKAANLIDPEVTRAEA